MRCWRQRVNKKLPGKCREAFYSPFSIFCLRLPPDGGAKRREVQGECHVFVGVGQVQVVLRGSQEEMGDSLWAMTASSLSSAL